MTYGEILNSRQKRESDMEKHFNDKPAYLSDKAIMPEEEYDVNTIVEAVFYEDLTGMTGSIYAYEDKEKFVLL